MADIFKDTNKFEFELLGYDNDMIVAEIKRAPLYLKTFEGNIHVYIDGEPWLLIFGGFLFPGGMSSASGTNTIKMSTVYNKERSSTEFRFPKEHFDAFKTFAKFRFEIHDNVLLVSWDCAQFIRVNVRDSDFFERVKEKTETKSREEQVEYNEKLKAALQARNKNN